MAVSKANFIRKTAALAILIITYFIATLFRLEPLSSILSPLNDFAAAGLLYFAYLRSDRTVTVRLTLLMLSIACAVWGIADIFWVIISLAGGAPDESPVLFIIYVITNCLLVGSLAVFVVHHLRKWEIFQFGIDLIISVILTVFLFWMIFLHKDSSSLDALLKSDFTSILSILSDILICISIFTWFLSVRGGKIPAFLRIISFGLVLFAFSDMNYYYLDFNGLYFPNSLSDFLYALSLVIIAYGAVWKTYKSSAVDDLTVVTNIGGRTRWVYLLLYPLVAVLLSASGAFRVNFSDLLTFFLLIFLYWASCKYIRVSLEKETLLRQSNELLEQRVAAQVQELKFLANQDTLTTLFNRRYFMACLDDTIKDMRANDLLALLIIDLDRFKAINDTFGHDIGDRILIDLSYRMIEWNNYGGTFARLGGDEFAVMFVGKYTQKDIEDFCLEIISYCCKPFQIGENLLNVTMSVGIALYAADTCDGKTMLQNADIAMYRAKSQGYNKYQIYNDYMSQDFKKAIEIEMLLRQADAEKDFELFYQPQYALPGKELIGAEALIRWKNPEHGYIPPNVFIPIAEQLDYIFSIGKWVMQETIRQSIAWNMNYAIPLKVGFNISPKQLKDEGFISLINALVKESGVTPEMIDAEITESIMMDDAGLINDTFSVLHELGISISIDDFGSGYSALGYLNKYPFDRLKIDKSLIDTISSQNVSGANVVKAAINMAHASGIQTIAEGVETQEQLDILVELGCDQVQGYHLGRPVPAEVFEQRYIGQYLKNTKLF